MKFSDKDLEKVGKSGGKVTTSKADPHKTKKKAAPKNEPSSDKVFMKAIEEIMDSNKNLFEGYTVSMKEIAENMKQPAPLPSNVTPIQGSKIESKPREKRSFEVRITERDKNDNIVTMKLTET